jgi:hypothetical protein
MYDYKRRSDWSLDLLKTYTHDSCEYEELQGHR